ncbi:MAG TPA: translation initiation factor IF-2, partial [Parachlamydiaceae bacterium]|nr:translation initiation factor IF-2 [Parachlamydiaceae bacterium]
ETRQEPGSSSESSDKTKPKFSQESSDNRGVKSVKAKEFRDVKPSRKADNNKAFDARDRQGLRGEDERNEWRKRRQKGHRAIQEDTTIRPTALKVRVPISIKDLAVQMKLKSSQLIAKLFLQGSVMTLNDLLDDEV